MNKSPQLSASLCIITVREGSLIGVTYLIDPSVRCTEGHQVDAVGPGYTEHFKAPSVVPSKIVVKRVYLFLFSMYVLQGTLSGVCTPRSPLE